MRSSDPARLALPGWQWRAVLTVVMLAFARASGAENLGVIGPVYEIAEPSLLEAILAQLKRAQASGELAKLEQDARRNVTRAIQQPAPVTSVAKTTRARTFYFDPSIVVPYPITDVDGRVIVPPGTRVNPLDTVSLSKRLLFFDGRDPAQVTRARMLIAQHGARVKLILTGGSYLDLMQAFALPVFYDQGGALVEKLQIKQVPALVTQDGKRLRIDELL